MITALSPGERDLAIDACRALWCELLTLAVEEACGKVADAHTASTANIRRIMDEAREWFGRPGRGVGSFLWVCNALNMNPGPIRAFVRRHENSGRFRLPGLNRYVHAVIEKEVMTHG